MPKRGNGGRGGRNWNNGGEGSRGYSSYNEHDNRVHDSGRRVSFKPNTNKIHKNKNRSWDNAIKHLNDDDIDMSGQILDARNYNNHRGNFRGKGKRGGRLNSPAPRPNYIPRKIQPGSPWYQIVIPYGQQQEKNFLLNALLTAMSPDKFVPYFYSVDGNAVIFYVDDFGMAEKLSSLDRKITMPSGFKLAVRVKSGTPNVIVDENLRNKMKLAMAGRYNPATKALDLSKFHADPNLVDVFCALFRPSIMLEAINIISENIPEIEALNLNDNKLHVLDHFRSLLKNLTHLKILYIGNNRIPHINSLEALKGLPLIELNLEGNPSIDRMKEKDLYVREVRKKFPKLLRLDGKDLPPVIGFDVNEEVSLPPVRASFLCNMEGQGVVKQFLEQYYAIYDSDSRQPLLDAYHENAMFSLTASYGHGQSVNTSNNRLTSYFPIGRNIMRVMDRDTRRRNIKTSRLQVVSFLNDLPKTQHDPLSFCVDLTLCTSAMLVLTVNGVFKELSSAGSSKPAVPPVRAFHKTMIIVPQGAGFCIKNDMLHITNATIEQEENSFKTPVIVSNPAPPPYTPAPQPVMPNVAVPPPIMDTHQQMVQAFSLQTHMNIGWSTSCLEQSNWDFQRASLIFENLHKEGKIPPEAFVK